MAYLMGIDLGTSSVKTIIMDAEGCVIGLAQAGYDIQTPLPGYAEQDPEIWWQQTCLTIRQAIKQADISNDDISAVGLSGQMHGMVLTDKNGKPLRPAIIWCDQRSKTEVEHIYSLIGTKRLGELTLNPVATGFQTPSLLWVKKHQPEIYEQTYQVLLPKDYIRLKLTGEFFSDITDASSTLAFDTAHLCWCEELLDALNLDKNKYPPVGNPCDLGGNVTAEAQRETGLKKGTSVTLGGGDQPMQAIGNGIVETGTVSCTIGTGGQLFTPIHTPTHDPQLRTHTFCHAVPGTWNIMGATLNAGLSLKWLNRNVLPELNFKQLDEGAIGIKAGSESLLFLPYLTGERTPHFDSSASASFFGLTLRHDRFHMARAVMEGVVFALRDSLEIFKSLGLAADHVIASGGGAQSKLWLQIQADIFGCEVYTTQSTEQACTGAAITAGVGCGIYSSIPQACKAIIKTSDRPVVPNPENVKIYEALYPIFQELYQTNKSLMRRIANDKQN